MSSQSKWGGIPSPPRAKSTGALSSKHSRSRLSRARTRTRSSEHALVQPSRSWTSWVRSETPEQHSQRAVVIDTGTGACKAGFAGQEIPQVSIRTLIGHLTGKTWPDILKGEVDISLPVRHGVIVDWEAADFLWKQLFSELNALPEEHALLMSDPPLCPITNREKLVEVVFESLNSPAMYVACQSVLSVYAHGKTSGLVVETGYATTHTVPVYQGYNLPHETERMDIAGSNMTSFLMDLLKDKGYYLDDQMLEDIKHKCCYVALNSETETESPASYQLPDGHVITLGKERFQCPELLFHPPQTPGLSLVGIHDMALRSLRKVPEECKKDMYENILLCGGSSLFEGFEERLTHDIMAGETTDTKVKVAAIPLRQYSVWTGGSLLASLTNFQTCWVWKEHYNEHGPCIVYKKCY
ncbi:actin-like protein 9 [Anolis sagrei]|uniref:actin-like protein 9 n=1 Tax=Anolis sagrei TaxID=38937 RepID=UPI003522B245